MNIKSNRRAVQVSLCIAVFLVPFMGSSLNLATPLIGRDFSMSAFSLSFMVSAYLLGTAMFQMPAARMGDLLGRRKLFLVGLAAFGVFSLLSAFAWSGLSLTLFRFASGIGSALVFATNMAILTAVFPKEERGRVLGINTAVVYFAVAVGPSLGGLLAQHLGWRSIFLISAALTLLAIAVSAASIKDEWAEAAGEPFDMKGSLVYCLGVGGIVLGFTYSADYQGWSLLAAGIVAAIYFVRMEKKVEYPMLKLDLFFDNRHFRLASLSAMINYSASFAVGFILSLYLQFVHGLLPDKAGLVLMAQPVAQTLLSPLAGRLSDRVNPSLLTTSGMGVIAVGLFLLSLLTPATPLWAVVCILVLMGVGFTLFSSPNVNIIMGSVSTRDSGTASATTGTARQIGQSLSMATTSLIIGAYMGHEILTTETAVLFLPAMKTGLLIFVGICLVGVYTSGSKLFGDDGKKQWRHISVRRTIDKTDT